MVSSSDQPEPEGSEPEKLNDVAKPKPNWMAQIDAEQSFRLIDSILPFEACLYHQVMPLSLEGSRLKLGMVNTDDSAALDYVRRILAYMNCSLVPHPLASDIHYAALSAYLNYADNKKRTLNPTTPQPVTRRIAKKLTEHSVKQTVDEKSSTNQAVENQPSGLHDNPTLLVDSPTELPLLLNKEPALEALAAPPEEAVDAAIAPAPPILEINPQHLSEPSDLLIDLPPRVLLEELLGRILSWGIGRLHIERRLEQGCVLWSQNGVVQPILEEVPLDSLQSILNELKVLMQLPRIPAHKIKQVEIERLYLNERLLLRLRLTPGKYGEEATLQALRGAALRFYRQQQLVGLGQDAIALTQQLQAKMNEIHDHSRSYKVALPAHLDTLPELRQSIQRLNQQLNELESLKIDDDDS
jgi:uncharacterized protein YoxC